MITKDHGADSEQFVASMKDMTCIDPDLHEMGVAQAQLNSPQVESLNVKHVMVSRMQRAMQTAINMFKYHPKLADIKFTVVPEVHEIVHTFNDMHMDANELIKKYAPGEAITEGCNFDFSRLTAMGDDINLWSVNTLSDKETREGILEKIRAMEGGATYENVKTVFLGAMGDKLPDGALENKDNLYDRSKVAGQVIMDFVKENTSSEDEVVAVVFHSQMISALTCDGVEGSGKDSKFINFRWT